jgi:hypothetical protein
MPDNYDALVNMGGSANQTDSKGRRFLEIGSGRKKKQKGESQRKLRRILDTAELRETNGFDDLWNDMLKLYSSRYDYPELGSYQDVIAPNIAFSTVNIIVPSVALNNPKFVVSPRDPKESQAAEIAEVVINYQWEALDIGEEFRLAAKDFSIFGHGWLKTTWKYETRERPMAPEEFEEEAERLFQQREDAIDAGVDPADLPTVDQIVDNIPKTTDEIVHDDPQVLRVSPFDIFVDPDATTLRDARWIAHRMIIPLTLAQKDKRWSPKQRSLLSPTAVSQARDTVDKASDVDMSDDAEFAEIYEFYDLVDNTVCTIGVGCDDYLMDPVDIPFSFGHPFVFIPNYLVPERFYPIGDIESIFNLQMELATTRTQMINDRKRFRRVYMYKPDSIEPDSLDKFRNGDDEVLVEVLRDVPFSEVMAPMQSSPLPPEFYQQTEMIQGDINVVSGVNEYQRGVAQPIRRTATEAAMMQDAANARSAEKLNRIERAASQVAYNVIALNQQFLDVEKVARIVGDDGQVAWMAYDASTLAGGLDFKVETGSTRPTDDSMRQQKALQLLDVMMPFMGEVVDPRIMAEHVLRQFGVRDTERFMMAPPSEMGMPPGGMPPEEGMPPDQGGMPQNGGGMPPEMNGIPPEMLEQLAAMGGQGFPQ